VWVCVCACVCVYAIYFIISAYGFGAVYKINCKNYESDLINKRLQIMNFSDEFRASVSVDLTRI